VASRTEGYTLCIANDVSIAYEANIPASIFDSSPTFSLMRGGFGSYLVLSGKYILHGNDGYYVRGCVGQSQLSGELRLSKSGPATYSIFTGFQTPQVEWVNIKSEQHIDHSRLYHIKASSSS